MEDHVDDSMHSGGIPTTIVQRTVLSATVEWSRSSKYRSTGMVCPIKGNQGKVKGSRSTPTRPVLSVAGVIYRHMTVVALDTTI
jgi:hypothetical protein